MEVPDAMEILRYAGGLAAIWFVSVACYGLLFDPLRHIPGPFLARMTDAYAGWFAFGKTLHIATYHNFQKYGPVVRQGPRRVVFNTVAALHDIYPSAKLNKGGAYAASILAGSKNSLFNAIDRDAHRRKRRFVGEALTERSMRAFEPAMRNEIDVFLRLVLKSTSGNEPVDMTPLLQHLGIDIVGMLAFGYPLRTQTEETNRFLQTAIDGTAWRVNVYMQFPILRFLERLIMLIGMVQIARFRNKVSHMIETRLAEPADARQDLYKAVSKHTPIEPASTGKRSKADEEVMAELVSDALFFIMAGGNTTATSMCSTFFYLSRNKAAYDRLAAEIRSTFQSDDEICSGPKLNSCKYLRACIDESIRMSTPSPAIFWREPDEKGSKAKGSVVIEGHAIPSGTQVGVNLYSILHNEEYFPDSFTWNPDRWHQDKGDGIKSTKAFAPFLLGDRACAGRGMAYMEASLVIARTIWLFDFEAAPGTAGELGGGTIDQEGVQGGRGEYQLRDVFAAEHDGPNLVFRTRGEHWKVFEAIH
ncbi:cytochrome P450 [Stachybotrys elegans]|uniref:Cytochrome P450 n=1 Tax=Stachybotrys elegans TaxID=80388 RepID=A0A8K0WQ55_9HYPO|nr:cytochrome P450 [Stachybotrys elegans]